MHDISVIIPTYNRAQDLRKTLEGMVRADKGNLAVEIVVVDNGNTDQTKLVVESFHDRLQTLLSKDARWER
jgi:validoxylamine A glucosyltransferase